MLVVRLRYNKSSLDFNIFYLQYFPPPLLRPTTATTTQPPAPPDLFFNKRILAVKVVFRIHYRVQKAPGLYIAKEYPAQPSNQFSYTVFPTVQSVRLESRRGRTTFCRPVPSSTQIARRFRVEDVGPRSHLPSF